VHGFVFGPLFGPSKLTRQDKHTLANAPLFIDSNLLVSEPGGRSGARLPSSCLTNLLQLVRAVHVRDSSLNILDSCTNIRSLTCIGVDTRELSILVARNPALSELALNGVHITGCLLEAIPRTLVKLDLGMTSVPWIAVTRFLASSNVVSFAVRGSCITSKLPVLDCMVEKCRKTPVTLNLSDTPGVSPAFLAGLAMSVRHHFRRDSGVSMEDDQVKEPRFTLIVNDCDQLTGADIIKANELGNGCIKSPLLSIQGNPKLADNSEQAAREYIRYLCGV